MARFATTVAVAVLLAVLATVSAGSCPKIKEVSVTNNEKNVMKMENLSIKTVEENGKCMIVGEACVNNKMDIPPSKITVVMTKPMYYPVKKKEDLKKMLKDAPTLESILPNTNEQGKYCAEKPARIDITDFGAMLANGAAVNMKIDHGKAGKSVMEIDLKCS